MEFTELPTTEVSATAALTNNNSPAPTAPTVSPLLSDTELAELLDMTLEWVRAYAPQLPGFERLGMYFRFQPQPIERWLGSLEPVMDTGEVASVLKVPKSWVYANADQIAGCLHLGRYVRFRRALIRRFIGGSGTCQ